MERIDLSNLHEVLGIHSPWHINSIELDKLERTLTVHIDSSEKKKLFGLIEASKNSRDKVSEKWFYMPIGGYACIVQAEVPGSENPQGISLSQLGDHAFLGEANRNYSHYVRQQVALAEIKAVPKTVICGALRINETVYDQVKSDLQSASPKAKALAFLPTEVDIVWHRILSDQIIVTTSLLPLKLLLSKLKLATAKTDSGDEISKYCAELRQFFMTNAHLLESEIDQVCGINNDKMKRQASAVKQKQKLVLPSIKNPVWIDLLTGRLNLNSQSVPLNLLVSRQRVAFLQAKTTASRIQAIEVLREYIKKNYRLLKPELVLINRAIQINEKTKFKLPNPDHKIWQRILSDDTFVPSEHIAYKLLLAKLRVQIKNNTDPVIKLEAARSIRSFMHQNQKALRRELSEIVKQLQTG